MLPLLLLLPVHRPLCAARRASERPQSPVSLISTHEETTIYPRLHSFARMWRAHIDPRHTGGTHEIRPLFLPSSRTRSTSPRNRRDVLINPDGDLIMISAKDVRSHSSGPRSRIGRPIARFSGRSPSSALRFLAARGLRSFSLSLPFELEDASLSSRSGPETAG